MRRSLPHDLSPSRDIDNRKFSFRDELREHLKNAPKMIMTQNQEVESSDSSSSSSSSDDSTSSDSSSESDSDSSSSSSSSGTTRESV